MNTLKKLLQAAGVILLIILWLILFPIIMLIDKFFGGWKK